jgi:hypothetical protein
MLILIFLVRPPPATIPHSLVTSKNNYHRCQHNYMVGHPRLGGHESFSLHCCHLVHVRLTLYQAWPRTCSYLSSQCATRDALSPSLISAAQLCTAARKLSAATNALVQVYG